MYLLSLAAVLEAASMFEVIAGIAALVALVIWLTFPTGKAGEPQMMKYSVPFLGHALAFAKDKRALITWGRYVPFSPLVNLGSSNQGHRRRKAIRLARCRP